MLFVNPVTLGGKQRHSRRLQPAPAHLQLHQRAGLGLPPAQPEERPSEEALRRPQVRREENRRGSLWLVNPRSGQGARGRWWEVERRGCDWQWEKEGVVAAPPPSWELSMAAADWRLYTTWNMRARDLPEAPATKDRLCVCVLIGVYLCECMCETCVRWMAVCRKGWQRRRRPPSDDLLSTVWFVAGFGNTFSVFWSLLNWAGFAAVHSLSQQSNFYYFFTVYWCLIV